MCVSQLRSRLRSSAAAASPSSSNNKNAVVLKGTSPAGNSWPCIGRPDIHCLDIFDVAKP